MRSEQMLRNRCGRSTGFERALMASVVSAPGPPTTTTDEAVPRLIAATLTSDDAATGVATGWAVTDTALEFY